MNRFYSLRVAIFVVPAILFIFSGHLSAQYCSELTGPVYDKSEDLIVTTYHSHIALGFGYFITWGEDMDDDGDTDKNELTVISPANGYNYTGDPLMVAISGNAGAQAFLLTTDGLWAWGLNSEVVGGTLVDGRSFRSMALPTGVTASEVLDIKANSDVFFLVTTAGEVWIAGTNVAQVAASGSTTANTWHKVLVSAGGADFTGVLELSGNREVVYARKSDNTLWAWGQGIASGGGAATSTSTYPTQMDLSALPSGVTLSQLGVYMDNAANSSGLLTLGSDGKIYGIGYDGDGELITNTGAFVNDWTAVQNGSGSDFTNVVFVATSENSEEYASASIIVTVNGATNNLYTWGELNSNNTGQTANPTDDPTIPGGFSVGVDNPVYTSVGGHATSYINNNGAGTVCFVGHITNGSGGGLQTTAATFTCFGRDDVNWPAGIVLCNQGGIMDPDNDLVLDFDDLDDDNDGVLDVDENGGVDPNVDNDGDFVYQYLDDNDNNAGIGNNDGLPENDSDGDGVANHLDFDSDGDGISDLRESGQNPSSVDTNGDGERDDMSTRALAGVNDTDNDGLADAVDNGSEVNPTDTDSDGVDDFLDIDSDDDGIVDIIEAQLTESYIAISGTDTDGDGMDDSFDVDDGGTEIVPINTDATFTNSDAIPDYLDTNSDGDGSSDALEAYDTDNNGTADTLPAGSDADADGLDDNYDEDDASLDPDNGGQLSTSFPDLDEPGLEPDWRDESGAPNLNLDVNNSSGGTNDGSFSFTYTEGDAAKIIGDVDADIADVNDTSLPSLTIVVAGVLDGTSELLTIGGTDLTLNADASLTSGLIGSTTFAITYIGGTITIANNAGGNMPIVDMNALLDGITYRNVDSTPNEGNRTLTLTTTDGSINSNTVVSTINVQSVAQITINDPMSINEGNTGTSTINFTVSIDDSDPDADVTVDYAISGGNVNGNTGTLTFAASTIALAQDISVTTNGDVFFESDESISVTLLSESANASITDADGSSSFLNDDTNLPPVLDLDASGGGNDFAATFQKGGSPVSVGDIDVSITDPSDFNMESVTLRLTNRPNGSNETLSVIGGLLAGISITDTYSNTDGIITLSGSSSLADYEIAIKQIVYHNNSVNPNNDNREITVIVNDGDVNSNTAATTLSIKFPPTLSAIGPVETTTEEAEVEIDFLEISGNADEADADGEVTAFIVKGIESGTLRIGTSEASAEVYSATNTVINADLGLKAFWTPDDNESGTLAAFTVVARDDSLS